MLFLLSTNVDASGELRAREMRQLLSLVERYAILFPLQVSPI